MSGSQYDDTPPGYQDPSSAGSQMPYYAHARTYSDDIARDADRSEMQDVAMGEADDGFAQMGAQLAQYNNQGDQVMADAETMAGAQQSDVSIEPSSLIWLRLTLISSVLEISISSIKVSASATLFNSTTAHRTCHQLTLACRTIRRFIPTLPSVSSTIQRTHLLHRAQVRQLPKDTTLSSTTSTNNSHKGMAMATHSSSKAMAWLPADMVPVGQLTRYR